ncbi:MAG TPA: AAA family ATPase [Thermomicrobiales bacterium]|nr:AAA family ATPase [Thermomicrobiales bacterium]
MTIHAEEPRDLLSPAHRHELEHGSAISPEIIAERGYRSFRAAELPNVIPAFQRRDGLMIPINTVHGQRGNFQLKPDRPRLAAGKPVKYETIAGAHPCLDVPRRVVPLLGDPATPLWITEGAKKVDAALSNGIDCVIGLLGVWNWRGTNDKGGKVALPDWEQIALNGRPVIIAFDSDCMTKRSVREALDRLSAFLKRKGAQVGYCIMPPLDDGEKCGLDDFFAAGRSLGALFRCMTPTLPPAAGELVPDVVCLEDVRAESLEWLWHGWIPRRMLTILGGYGGDGKSTIMAAITAALSIGGRLPDGSRAPRTNVLILSAEDDPGYIVRPRLDIHGADVSRVFLLKGSISGDGTRKWLDAKRDIGVIRETIVRHKIGLVIIDPLSSYLPNADRNSEGEIRDALQPLLGLTEETGVAIVGIMHVGKSGDGRRAAQRLLGSTAFTALARSVIMVADLPDDQQPDDVETGGKHKVMQVVKSNYTIPAAAQGFRRPLDGPIAWLGASPVGIEECFAATVPTGKRGPEPMERKDAETLLREVLADGPMKASEIMATMKSMGLSVSSVRRAKGTLGVSSFRQAYNGPWMWKLPLTSQGAQVPLKGQNLNTLDILAYPSGN